MGERRTPPNQISLLVLECLYPPSHDSRSLKLSWDHLQAPRASLPGGCSHAVVCGGTPNPLLSPGVLAGHCTSKGSGS